MTFEVSANTSAAGNSSNGQTLSEYTAPGSANQKFRVIGPDPLPSDVAQLMNGPDGTPGWIRMIAREGYRTPGDGPTVRRIGLDVWSSADYPSDSDTVWRRETFDYCPWQNADSQHAEDWLNFHELRARQLSGDAGSVGPLAFFHQWSAGSSAPVFRILRHEATFNAAGAVTGTTAHILHQSTLNEQQTYRFVVEYRRHRTNGFVRVWRNGVQIVNYQGGFGYNSLNASGGLITRQIWPQFRIYQNAQRAGVVRTDVTSIYLRLVAIDQMPV